MRSTSLLIKQIQQKTPDLVLPLLHMDVDFYGTMNIVIPAVACAAWKNDATLWQAGRVHISSQLRRIPVIALSRKTRTLSRAADVVKIIPKMGK